MDGECIRPDPCDAVVCGDHGHCEPDTGECACDTGFAGADCSDADECLSSPCLNGGGCFHSGDAHGGSLVAAWSGRFVCACTAGFSGDRCQCPACGDHGACQHDTALCLCDAGYAGQSCEYDINDCASAPCEQGSTCVDGVDSYDCLCMPGFTGPSCDENIDDCASTPCRNGGVCQDCVNGHSCACVRGFTGDKCNATETAQQLQCSFWDFELETYTIA